MDSLASEKARMRAAAMQARKRLSAAERKRAAGEIADYAPQIAALAPGRVVSCFSTFGDELDTAPLVATLARLGVPLALPIVVKRATPLVFRRWRPGDEMASGPFGIKQPLPSAEQVEPTVFLTPLLVFDRRGYRVGYGGGFYDRTLAAAREARKVLALGLAFACQETSRVPTDQYDQPLDGVLTESEVIRCNGGARAAALPW